jgi:hypothetical protein
LFNNSYIKIHYKYSLFRDRQSVRFKLDQKDPYDFHYMSDYILDTKSDLILSFSKLIIYDLAQTIDERVKKIQKAHWKKQKEKVVLLKPRTR